MNRYPTRWLTALIISFLLSAAYCPAQNISGQVNAYYKVTAITVATSTLTLSSTTGLIAGMKVVIMQMKGATIDITNTATFGNITAINNAGNYEVNTICSIAGNNVLLKFALLKSYTTTGFVQLITLPKYTDAIVTGTITAQPWDPITGTGGVIAIESTNTLTLQASVDASDAGFKGATYLDFPIPPNDCNFTNNISDYAIPNPTLNAFTNGDRKGEGITNGSAAYELGRGKLANGGGGGNNHNSGGGGGGNYGAGGQGGERSMEGAFNCHGQFPGIGGLSLQTNGYSVGNNRIFMGGGGGAGQGNNNVGENGGNGGGIVILTTNELIGNNNIIAANGSRPFRAGLADPYAAGGDGGGGGGAGGVIILNVTNYTGNVQAQATGGRGSDASNAPSSGCFGPGGGGGGGIVWVKGASIVPLVTTALTSGSNGVISNSTTVVACRGLANNAASGVNGNVAVNYALPTASTLLCIPLAIDELTIFKAEEKNRLINVDWRLSDLTQLSHFVLERSIDQNNFSAIALVNKNASHDYQFIDVDAPSGALYYRLKTFYIDGRIGYSEIIRVTRKEVEGLHLISVSPNPSKGITCLMLEAGSQMKITIEIYNSTGQRIFSENKQLQKGIWKENVDLHSIIAGTYFIRVNGQGNNIVTQITKSN
jgi:hypothetical protein